MVLNQFFAQEIIGLKQLAKLKQQKKWKMIYAYNDITEQDWLNYKKETAKLFVDEDQSISQNINDLNKKWLNFHHMSKVRKFFTKTESVKKIMLNNRQKTTLMNIMSKVKLVSTVLPHDITPDNIAEYLHNLITINNLLIMINSFMNREIKSIVIDRVIVIENDEEILKIAPECIKKEVNVHFQNIAGSFNHEKLISGRWVDQYSPKTDIDINIYEELMDYITQEELDYYISILPNAKASGPSKISYEMIKHKDVVRSLKKTIY
ncbi:hypothetical protein C1646_774730 [Rhizophagus diaphanus]|nr:hypothetical protein C1646_774730 [Rhizophagus diaphanus] [Rhizophagus sp. MUCL 43196]